MITVARIRFSYHIYNLYNLDNTHTTYAYACTHITYLHIHTCTYGQACTHICRHAHSSATYSCGQDVRLMLSDMTQSSQMHIQVSCRAVARKCAPNAFCYDTVLTNAHSGVTYSRGQEMHA